MSSSADNSTTASDSDGPSYTQAQMFAWPGDSGADLKRAYDELLAQNKKYEAADRKRQKRKPKIGYKGENFKSLDVIKAENRLSESQECALGKMTRLKAWPDMKYYVAPYKEDLLNMAYKTLGMETKPDKERYADHILYFANKKLTIHTHNCVGYIKRKVYETDESGSKFDGGRFFLDVV
jgi:hypothetical protein